MTLRNVPLAERRSFIDVGAEMNARPGPRKVRREIKIGGRIVNGIPAEHYEQFNRSAPEIIHQRAQRLDVTCWLRFGTGGVVNRFTDIAEELVHRMSKRVNDGWLILPGDDDACTASLLEVTNQRGQPSRCSSRRESALILF